MDESLQYPIGKFKAPEKITDALIAAWHSAIAQFPEDLRKAVSSLNNEQLDTPYRQGGWTVRQVVHHCADSHANSLMRFKLALTEDNPIIKPYEEAKWAELSDSSMPIEPALQMIEGIHARWVVLLKSLSNHQFAQTYYHPEHKKSFRLDYTLALYAWHCNHHLAHITKFKERMNW
ncbi:MAG: putative metal-dependent hydrolase [Cyclobacteriaceae bacterium]|nr:putative metal-dependent hydrolase [Cyclobacteriaceae bacterium]